MELPVAGCEFDAGAEVRTVAAEVSADPVDKLADELVAVIIRRFLSPYASRNRQILDPTGVCLMSDVSSNLTAEC